MRDFVERFHYPIPLLVDSMDNLAEDAYAAWPERLYVIGKDGTILYKGAMGPGGFAPDEVDALLKSL